MYSPLAATEHHPASVIIKSQAYLMEKWVFVCAVALGMSPTLRGLHDECFAVLPHSTGVKCFNTRFIRAVEVKSVHCADRLWANIHFLWSEITLSTVVYAHPYE